MKIQYCLPIITSRKENVLKIMHENMNSFQYIEVWIDYIEDIDETFVKHMQKILGRRLVVVLRRQNLEKLHLTSELRRQVILLMHNSSALVDLDIFDQAEELHFIESNQLLVNTIISYHNYHETPPDSKLKGIVDTIKRHKPYIIKIATFCKHKTDAIRLLQILVKLKDEKQRCIILGMGTLGVVTRIFGTLWGNEMIFTPKNVAENSAPGQLTKMQLEIIFRQIGG